MLFFCRCLRFFCVFKEVGEITPNWGLGGLPQKQTIESPESPVALLFEPNMSWNARASFLLENQDSSIQMLKSSLFSKTEALIRENPMQEEMPVVKQRPSEVISTPNVYKLPNMSCRLFGLLKTIYLIQDIQFQHIKRILLLLKDVTVIWEFSEIIRLELDGQQVFSFVL